MAWTPFGNNTPLFQLQPAGPPQPAAAAPPQVSATSAPATGSLHTQPSSHSTATTIAAPSHPPNIQQVMSMSMSASAASSFSTSQNTSSHNTTGVPHLLSPSAGGGSMTQQKQPSHFHTPSVPGSPAGHPSTQQQQQQSVLYRVQTTPSSAQSTPLLPHLHGGGVPPHLLQPSGGAGGGLHQYQLVHRHSDQPLMPPPATPPQLWGVAPQPPTPLQYGPPTPVPQYPTLVTIGAEQFLISPGSSITTMPATPHHYTGAAMPPPSQGAGGQFHSFDGAPAMFMPSPALSHPGAAPVISASGAPMPQHYYVVSPGASLGGSQYQAQQFSLPSHAATPHQPVGPTLFPVNTQQQPQQHQQQQHQQHASSIPPPDVVGEVAPPNDEDVAAGRALIDDLRRDRTDRVVSARLSTMPTAQVYRIRAALEADGDLVYALCEHDRGNIVSTVIQRCGAFRCPNQIEVIHRHFLQLSLSQRGCIALPRIMAYLPPPAVDSLFALCLEQLSRLVCDRYANYVCKHFAGCNRDDLAERLGNKISEQPDLIRRIAVDKFGSYVIDELLKRSSYCAVQRLLDRLFFQSEDDLRVLCSDQFGNYIIQTAFDTLHRCRVDTRAHVAATMRVLAHSPFAINITKHAHPR